MGYLDKGGSYYEGDRQGDDLEVPPRPSSLYRWGDDGWEIDPVARSSAIQSQIDALESPQMYMRMLRETALVCIEDLATRLAEQMTANGTPTSQADILNNQIGYQKAKDLDDQIRELRGKL